MVEQQTKKIEKINQVLEKAGFKREFVVKNKKQVELPDGGRWLCRVRKSDPFMAMILDANCALSFGKDDLATELSYKLIKKIAGELKTIHNEGKKEQYLTPLLVSEEKNVRELVLAEFEKLIVEYAINGKYVHAAELAVKTGLKDKMQPNEIKSAIDDLLFLGHRTKALNIAREFGEEEEAKRIAILIVQDLILNKSKQNPVKIGLKLGLTKEEIKAIPSGVKKGNVPQQPMDTASVWPYVAISLKKNDFTEAVRTSSENGHDLLCAFSILKAMEHYKARIESGERMGDLSFFLKNYGKEARVAAQIFYEMNIGKSPLASAYAARLFGLGKELEEDAAKKAAENAKQPQMFIDIFHKFGLQGKGLDEKAKWKEARIKARERMEETEKMLMMLEDTTAYFILKKWLDDGKGNWKKVMAKAEEKYTYYLKIKRFESAILLSKYLLGKERMAATAEMKYGHEMKTGKFSAAATTAMDHGLGNKKILGAVIGNIEKNHKTVNVDHLPAPYCNLKLSLLPFEVLKELIGKYEIEGKVKDVLKIALLGQDRKKSKEGENDSEGEEERQDKKMESPDEESTLKAQYLGKKIAWAAELLANEKLEKKEYIGAYRIAANNAPGSELEKKMGAYLYWAIEKHLVINTRKIDLDLERLFGGNAPENPFKD